MIEIDVFIENRKTAKQHINDVLWNMYRGTKNSPNVLQSMHMALERFFLERAKNIDPPVLESWLLYMLRNAKSASITAIIVSIVLAFPEITFNVAKVLFQTKEFFIYDTNRMSIDQTAKSIYSIGSFNYENKIHQNERMKTLDDEHRKYSLEQLGLNYQFIKNKETSKEETEKRQQVIWDIFDQYYKELPDKSNETEFDKTWRLYLTRMDLRKMSADIEEKDGKIKVSLKPEIDSDLKKHSDVSISKILDVMGHSTLNLWASYKLQNDVRCKQYEQYNNDPKAVLKEVKEVIDGFNKFDNSDYLLVNRSIPGNVCSLLVRDYYKDLSREEKTFCKDIILEVANFSLQENYTYQIGDSVEAAISVLPLLLREFPEEKECIKFILILTLFDPNPMGVGREFSDYSKNAIVDNLWDISFDDAQSILSGYLLLKPKYEELRSELFKKNYKKNVYEVQEIQLIKEFVNENEKNLKKVIANQITINDLEEIENLDLNVLKTAFQLIPLKTDNTEHKELAKIIISTFAKGLLSNELENKIDYGIRHNFLEKLAYFVLNSDEQDIPIILKPFIDDFNNSEAIADLFQKFVYAEDKLIVYDNFWRVWSLFYEKIVELCKNGDNYFTKKIVKNYLFAEIFWKEDAKKWHTLKEADKRFFKKMTEDNGQCPSVLFSISKLLNNIGSTYLNDGVSWISRMLNNNKNLWSDDLEKDTVFYLENIVRKYVFMNHEKLRKTRQLKEDIIVILDFLIEKGFVTGYLLRENIL